MCLLFRTQYNDNMLSADIATLRRLSTQFRKAIDTAKNAREFTCAPLSNFPRACCGEVSDLLAQYLLENGIKSIYIAGTYHGEGVDDLQSHAWLEVDGRITIDITGDQFSRNKTFLYFDKPVWCGSRTDFHKLFEIDQVVVENGIDSFPESAARRMWKLYQIICKYLNLFDT